MNKLKNIFAIVVVLLFAVSCEKDINNLDKLGNVNAPKILSVTYDIKQDNSGVVTIMPQSEGVTGYNVKFGDVEGETATKFALNEKIIHTYPEGEYKVEIIGVGLTGLTTPYDADLMVSFKAPENLTVSITPDNVNPRLINVSATADFATVMDVYLGEVEDEEPVTVLPGEVASNLYEEPGDYEIKVVARSGGEATTEISEIINIPEAADPVYLPINFESFTVNYAFSDFGGNASTVIDNPDASGINTSARVAQAVKGEGSEVWAGSLLTLGDPIDFSINKLFKMKVWSPKSGAIVKLKVENLDSGDIAYEVDATTTVSNEWQELEYDFSAIDVSQEYQKIVFFFDFDNVGDGSTYYFDDVRLVAANLPSSKPVEDFEGEAPEFTAFGNIFDVEILANPDQSGLNTTATVAKLTKSEGSEVWAGAFFEHTEILDLDNYSNIKLLTWSPKSGITIKIKLENDDASITHEVDVVNSEANAWEELIYDFSDAPAADYFRVVVFFDFDVAGDGSEYYFDEIELMNEGGGGGGSSPWSGTWQVASEAAAIGVGNEGQGSMNWWSNTEDDLITRACYFDDTYVFGSDGSFMNILGNDTWVEEWQGQNPPGCFPPVVPHDGSNPATFTWNETAGTLTLNGVGSYLGIPKAINGAEITNPADAPESVTYIVEFQENNTVAIVDIEIGGGGWWRYKLIKN
jgi:hypothetical protein